jgi:hypothetical protein
MRCVLDIVHLEKVSLDSHDLIDAPCSCIIIPQPRSSCLSDSFEMVRSLHIGSHLHKPGSKDVELGKRWRAHSHIKTLPAVIDRTAWSEIYPPVTASGEVPM